MGWIWQQWCTLHFIPLSCSLCIPVSLLRLPIVKFASTHLWRPIAVQKATYPPLLPPPGYYMPLFRGSCTTGGGRIGPVLSQIYHSLQSICHFWLLPMLLHYLYMLPRAPPCTTLHCRPNREAGWSRLHQGAGCKLVLWTAWPFTQVPALGAALAAGASSPVASPCTVSTNQPLMVLLLLLKA